MRATGQELAQKLEEANDALISAIEQCSPEQWGRPCPDEGWTVAATARHVVGGNDYLSNAVNAVASGQQIQGLSMDQLNQMNAQNAQKFANCDRQETISELRRSGLAAAETLRGLSDEGLANTSAAFGQSMTAAQIAEHVLIGHIQGHTASIKAGLGP